MEPHELRSLRVDPPDDGFSAELHRRLVGAGPPRPPGVRARLREAFDRWPALAWPAVGVAAGIAAFVLMGQLQGMRGEPTAAPITTAAHAPDPAAEVPSTKVALIRLNFHADVAVESAELHVELPPGLSFWSGGTELAQRSIAWDQPLAAGDNVIPIAVRGAQAGEYRVVATASVQGQRIEHAVLLKVIDG